MSARHNHARGETVYKDRAGGRDEYHIWSYDEQRRYFISAETARRLVRDGARLVDVARCGR